MAGKIVADTLEHSTAGSVTTDYVVNGSAKVWANYNDSTPALLESLNVSSTTDVATGRFRLTFTNAMGNANYSSAGNANISGHYLATGVDSNGNAQTTSAVDKWTTRTDTGALADSTQIGATIHGDLA